MIRRIRCEGLVVLRGLCNGIANAARGWRRYTRAGVKLMACLPWLILSTVSAQSLPTPLLDVNFDQLAQGVLPAGVTIRTQFASPDVVPGVTGTAWRTDGFSSYAEAALSLDPSAGFTLSLWVALESYPSDREVPVADLAPSSIAQQAAGDAGLDLYIDTYGRWGFRIATSVGVLRAPAPARFPLNRWVHIVASVDTTSGVVNLYQDGALLASARGVPGMTLRLAPAPLRLATPPTLARILQFTINRLNAAYDLVAVYPGALGDTQRALLPRPSSAQMAGAEPSLRVPDSRFAGDHLRPRIHPMPPANWTNEPHGLVRVGDKWHMFYQRTPNGPFKTQMHWGHMSSRDLVRWEHRPDALRPELQTDRFGFDMKGIWSGHVITDGGKAFAFYTSVNHGDRLAASNPGIAMAVSEDADLQAWRKLGPILDTREVRDFRDPYLWKEDGTWHMLIGAALEKGGGLEYLVLEPGARGGTWQRRQRFLDTSYRALDPGSEIWEMPVFERLSDSVSILLVNPIGRKISKYGEPATRAVYWTGQWTDGVFKPHFRTPRNLDLLPGHLAPTVGRAEDGRLRAIGIIDERRSPEAQERAGWANAFSLPRVWFLMPDQLTLGQAPAPELQALRAERSVARPDLKLGPEAVRLAPATHAYEMLVEFDAATLGEGQLTIDVLASEDGSEYTRLLFAPSQGRVGVDKSKSTLSSDGEGPQVLGGPYDAQAFGSMRTVRVIVDGSTIEVFVNDAAAYAVRSYPSRAASTQMRIGATRASNVPASVQVWPLVRPPA